MTCPTPFETLARWWLGELPEAESTTLEEHLFSCDGCAAASEGLGKLVSGLRQWTPPIISHGYRDRLAREGKRLRLTQVEAGVSAHARFDRDLDMLIHVLRADLSGAERVDVEIAQPGKAAHLVLEHVPFDRAAGEVLVACQQHFRDLGDPVFRVFAVEQGKRRPVGDYQVIHEWM